MEELIYEAAIVSSIQLITNLFEIILCIIFLLAALFVLSVFRSIVYYLYLRLYLPGPRGTFFLGNAEEINNELINYEDSKHQFWKLNNERYKGVYRIVIGHQVYVILRDAGRIETLLRNSTPKAECILDKLYPFLGQGILTHQRLDWQASRKLICPLFTLRTIQDYMPEFNESAEQLMEVWSRLPDLEIVPLGNYLNRYTIEVLINCMFHRKRGVQETPDMSVLIYIRKLAAIHGAIIARQYNPAHHFDRIYYRSASGQKFLSDKEDANSYLSSLILESVLYKQGELYTSKIKKGRNNIMETLLRYKDKKGQKLSITEIFNQVNNLMFCAFQPTAISLQFILYCLGINEGHQESCRHEVLTVMSGRRDIKWSDIMNFRFLTKCVYEALRIYAPTGSLCRQMDKSTVLDGYWIPPGTKLLTNVWHLHEDPKVWPDPHRFNPHRFKNEEVRKSFSYLPFSDGPRKCLGHQFVMAEIKVLLAYILMNYRIKVPRDYQMDRVNRFFLAPRQDVKVQLKKFL